MASQNTITIDQTDQTDQTDSAVQADKTDQTDSAVHAGNATQGGDPTPGAEVPAPVKKAARKRATRKAASAAVTPEAAPVNETAQSGMAAGDPVDGDAADDEASAAPRSRTPKTTTKKTAAKKATRKAAAPTQAPSATEPGEDPSVDAGSGTQPDMDESTTAPVAKAGERTAKGLTKRAPRRRSRAGDDDTTAASEPTQARAVDDGGTGIPPAVVDEDALRFDALVHPVAEVGTEADLETAPEVSGTADGDATDASPFGPLFQPPAPSRRRRASAPSSAPAPSAERPSDEPPDKQDDGQDIQQDAEHDNAVDDTDPADTGDAGDGSEGPRRRRRRGGKGRRSRSGGGSPAVSPAAEPAPGSESDTADEATAEPSAQEDGGDSSSTSRRRTRRRRRSGGSDGDADEPGVTTKVRESRRDEVTALKGSTRLEAKKQRRREGREAGRRRTVITEAEFLARRESVERVMVVRRVDERTQIGVLEDGVLVEHYISKETSVSMAGNIYLGRVQNVLPSMEAAFVDIGKGRNAVLYAGEVNWDAAGLESNQPKRIENALSSGQTVLVQVTKDPIGHKGARLTSQISLPGRYLVYVPNSSMTGISRKLPDTERSRLKRILKEVVPDTAGVIVRTAAEGASEDELRADVERLTATWEEISAQAEAASGTGKKMNKGGNAPSLLHGEPDLTVRVIRDIFNEDVASLVVAGQDVWDEVSEYVGSVAPDLADRLRHWTGEEDLFTRYRVDEQIAKAMDRKVWLPSGGSLVIDRTEAMTVVDVNTGKFIGSGGNLEETVTKNNLEAAEEIVRQLRLRDVGGIIVIDFIDMVLESNRDLVVRRLLECLGRDRTKHQVAEVTSLGLVQMTRKRVGSGLIEVFSEACEACGGRGIIIHTDPVDRSGNGHEHLDSPPPPARSSSTQRGRGRPREVPATPPRPNGPTPAQIAAAAHAAAVKTALYAGEPAPEPTADAEPAGQIGFDVSAQLDAVEAALGEESSPDEQALVEVGAQDGTLILDGGQEGPFDEVHEVDSEDAGRDGTGPEPDELPSTDSTDSGDSTSAPEPASAPDPDAGRWDEPVAPPPTRPRRHRGRVVAPAGPPRSAGSVGDDGTTERHGAD